ncbi:MAG: hypothetical protein HY815_22925 [Candidatus Riflebacteria bacterium]|nr:hypothetical protein [Candidatus Riflebacteria bacterium]
MFGRYLVCLAVVLAVDLAWAPACEAQWRGRGGHGDQGGFHSRGSGGFRGGQSGFHGRGSWGSRGGHGGYRGGHRGWSGRGLGALGVVGALGRYGGRYDYSPYSYPVPSYQTGYAVEPAYYGYPAGYPAPSYCDDHDRGRRTRNIMLGVGAAILIGALLSRHR